MSTAARTLRCYYNWLALSGLPQIGADPLQAIRDAGYDGVQLLAPLDRRLVDATRALGLGVCGSGRVNQVADAAPLASEAREAGLECLTLHVGWGIESDAEAAALIEAILAAERTHGVPVYVETHRATIFQDLWRSVELVRRFPMLRFNGDFSHWYTGSELVYGGFERKLEFIRPIIERTRFLHGRIGDPGCMQIDIGTGDPRQHPSVAHFRRMWTDVFRAWLADATAPPAFCFTTELLAADIYYARCRDGSEQGDRWTQSQVLCRIARECFLDAGGAI
jgi:hypothetical protein